MSKLKKAMEKAREARKVVEHESIEASSSPQHGDTSTIYSQAQVLQVDEAVLKKNKIISFFHDKAMTNQMKILRTRVLNKMEQIGGNSLLVTSADPGVGKTLTTINLAVSISQEVERTALLVDADLKAPSVHKCFGLNTHKGLSDYLLNEEALPGLLVNPGIENLVILPAGEPLPNSAELLGAPKMESLAKEMKARYSDLFVVFDSPAVLSCADPLVLSRLTDGVLLVVEQEKTAAEDLTRALELLEQRAIIGTVLNKAKE